MNDAADLNPSINTVTVESVKARQCAQRLVWLKLWQANPTFADSVARDAAAVRQWRRRLGRLGKLARRKNVDLVRIQALMANVAVRLRQIPQSLTDIIGIWSAHSALKIKTIFRVSNPTIHFYDTSPPPQPFYGPFSGPPRWAGATKELLDFIVQRKINRGRHTDHPKDATPSGLSSAHLHHPPF